MKRLTLAAAAALMFAGPLAGTAFADPPSRHDTRGQSNGWRDNDNRRDNDARRGDVRRDNDRNTNRWDRARHNGYYVNGRWYRGQPSAAVMARRDFRADYRAWRRGERLTAYERARFARVDYRRERLRAPPRGYQYVRDDRGELLLVAIATGVILSVILNSN